MSISASYAPRTVEVTLKENVSELLRELEDPDEVPPLRALIVLGGPGNGAQSIVFRGLGASLGDRARIGDRAWHTVPVQLCTAASVPSHPPPTTVDATPRLLVVACHDLAELPEWLRHLGDDRRRIFTVGPLSLIELHDFVEARLGGPVDLGTARSLGTAAGFVPGTLTWLIREALATGSLERVAGTWQLVREPVAHTVVPYVRARLAALDSIHVDALSRLALAEPVDPSEFESQGPAPTRSILDELMAQGFVERGDHSQVRFRAPALAEALRLLSPDHLTETVHRSRLAQGRATPATIRWAWSAGMPISDQLIDKALSEALSRHDWRTAVTLAELAIDITAQGGSETADDSALRLAELHLNAATAARFLDDADRAYGHLDDAEANIDPAVEDQPSEVAVSTGIDVARAELLHYKDGDPDAALNRLGPPRSTTPHVRPEKHQVRDMAIRIAHHFIHLCYAGRATEAANWLETRGSLLRRAPQELRLRTRLAAKLLMVAQGKPKQALRRVTALAVQGAVTPRRGPWVDEELRLSYFIAALGSDGPAAFPSISKYLDDTGDGTYRPDLVSFSLARATVDYLEGSIEEAHRTGGLALATTAYSDPSGIAPALVGFLAQTSALLGDEQGANEMITDYERSAPRASEVIAGGTHAHLCAARFLLNRPDAEDSLRAVADQLVADGRYGFAAEVLYSGVRFGRKRPARALADLAGHLDGNFHGMRLAHAEALLNDDPLALSEISTKLDDVGLHLFAAEAAVLAARLPSAPAAVGRRAATLVSRLLKVQSLPGHSLLSRYADKAAGTVSGIPTALTPREREMSELISAGLSNREIAGRLHLSLRTVEGHIARLYRKTGQDRRSPGRTRQTTR